MRRGLIITPVLTMPGGVSTYWNTLREHMPDETSYFEIGGSTFRGGNIPGKVKTYLGLLQALSMRENDFLILNPSFLPKSLFRDAFFLLLGRLFRKRVIIIFHGWDWSFFNLSRKVLGRGLGWGLSFASSICVLSTEFAAALRRSGYVGPIHTVTTAVPDSIFARRAKSYKNLAGRDHNLLFLSRLEVKKGVIEAILGYEIVRRDSSKFRLVVAGKGPSEKTAQDIVGRHGIHDVSFSGHVSGDAKSEIFRNADIFLFPSSYGEGMPIALLEAMAFGLPIITTSVGGISDFFEDGKMGILLDGPNPEKIARAILKLIDDVGWHREISEYNRNYALTHFSASVVADRLTRIVDDCVSE